MSKKEKTLQEVVTTLNYSIPEGLLEEGVCLSYNTNGYCEVMEYAGCVTLTEDGIDSEEPLLPQVLDFIKEMAGSLQKLSASLEEQYRK